jgi:L-seryl-tRNA(Ser) seleniumtransferase
LRVHPSNFRIRGYTSEVEIEALCQLDAQVIDDIGSGSLIEHPASVLADEPSVVRSVAAGAALVCFSGDKLVGGPQAGLMVGKASAIEACRAHPLARALRIGRLPLAALAATLALYRDPNRAMREIPVLAMLTVDEATLQRRARQLAAQVDGKITQATAKVGGGAFPLLELEGPVVMLPNKHNPTALAAALRGGDPPLISRIARTGVLLDPRTLRDDEIDVAARVVTNTQRQAGRPTS